MRTEEHLLGLPTEAPGLVALRAALGAIALGTGWVALHAVVFSYAKGIFHSYYTSALAPGLAALMGIGAAAVLAEACRDRAWLAHAGGGVVVSSGLAVKLSHRARPFFGWTRPVSSTGSDGKAPVPGERPHRLTNRAGSAGRSRTQRRNAVSFPGN